MSDSAPLWELRKALNLSQEAFAARVGSRLCQPTISNVELRKKVLTPSQALGIADHFRATMNRLGLTVEDLLRGSRSRDT